MALVIATLIVAAIGTSISGVYLWLSLRWRRLGVRPWPYVQQFRYAPAPAPQAPGSALQLPQLSATFGNRGEPGHSAVLLAQAGGILWLGGWVPATRLQSGTCQMSLVGSLKNQITNPKKVALAARDLDGRWWLDTDDEPRLIGNLKAAQKFLSARASAVAISPLRVESSGDTWRCVPDIPRLPRSR